VTIINALTQASSTDAEPGDAPAVAEAAEAVPATNRGDDTGDDTGGDPAGVELTADDPDRILHVDPAEMTCVCPSAPPSPPGAGVPAGAVGVTGPVELGHVALLSSAADVVGAGEASRGARERPEPYGHAECLPTPPRRHTDGATDPVGGIRSSVRVVVGTGGHRARRGVPPRRP
jgi:hypothetical protein